MGHSSYFGYSLVHQVIVMISHQFSSEREHGGDTMSDLNYASLNATSRSADSSSCLQKYYLIHTFLYQSAFIMS
jgi:hypothetical protein